MRKRIPLNCALVIVVATAMAAVVLLRGERLQAQPLPLDECTDVGRSPVSRLCLHQFSDHTKCVVSVTRGAETSAATTTALSCKFN
jgi:hypothetical protein